MNKILVTGEIKEVPRDIMKAKRKKKTAINQNPNQIGLHLFNLKIEISEWKRNLSKVWMICACKSIAGLCPRVCITVLVFWHLSDKTVLLG